MSCETAGTGSRPLEFWRFVLTGSLAVLAACTDSRIAPATGAATLRIGVAASKGSAVQSGLPAVLGNMQTESLVSLASNGRAEPWIAKRWTSSDDGLRWVFDIRDALTFHDGTAVTGEALVRILTRTLPVAMGPFADDIAGIRASSERQIEIVLKRRSTFLLEALEISIVDPTSGPTGAYRVVRADHDGAELVANTDYWNGKPEIDRVMIKRYDSVRTAWAEMLRGESDVLYDVGIDAAESLRGASDVKLFPFRRRYMFEVILNPHRPGLQSAEVRRRLNGAIDREALVRDALGGYGRAATSPVWPEHWANSDALPTFQYKPVPLDAPLTFTCIFPDAALERLGLLLQRQLSDIGVDLRLELVSLDEWNRRWEQGDFDALLGDILNGPTAYRMVSTWYSASPKNYTHYDNAAVDAAVVALHDAPGEAHYRRAFADFERALIEDPPAIFLAWSIRARAVSTRFAPPEDRSRDAIATIRFWHLAPVPPRVTH